MVDSRLDGADFFQRLRAAIVGRKAFAVGVDDVGVVADKAEQVAGAFCQDAGQGALGKMVELCGTVLCLCTGLPLATMLLELLQELGGG